MINILRTFAWLRLVLLWNSFRRRRRDSFEMLSAITSIAVPAIILVFFLIGSVLLGWMSFLAGSFLGSGRVETDLVFVAMRLVSMMLFLVVLVFPIGRGQHASLASHPRFMLLPVPRKLLHALEVATTVSDPWVLIAVPGLVMFPAGLLFSGQAVAGTLTFLAGCGFLAAIVSMAALVSYTLQFILRDRRRRELAMLVGTVALIVLSLLPAYLSGSAPEDEEFKVVIRGFEARSWMRVFPSELYALTAQRSLDRGTAGALLPLAALLAEAILLYYLSGVLFDRLIGSAETGRARRRGEAFPRFPDLPFLSSTTTAVAAILVRASLRTIKGKLGVFTPGPMTLLLGFVLLRLPSFRRFAEIARENGPLFLGLVGLMCLLSIHPIILNQFAIDRSGLSLLFASPIDDRTLLRGKALGGAALFMAAMIPCVAACAIVLPGGSPLLWLSASLGLIAAYALTTCPAAMLSTFFPKASNLNTMGSAGNAHPLAGLAGFFITVIALIPASAITAILMNRPLLAVCVSAAWMCFCVAIAVPLLNVSAIFLEERRESLGQIST